MNTLTRAQIEQSRLSLLDEGFCEGSVAVRVHDELLGVVEKPGRRGKMNGESKAKAKMEKAMTHDDTVLPDAVVDATGDAPRPLQPVPEETRLLIQQLERCADFLSSLIGCIGDVRGSDSNALANTISFKAAERRDAIDQVLAPYPSIAGQRPLTEDQEREAVEVMAKAMQESMSNEYDDDAETAIRAPLSHGYRIIPPAKGR